MFIEAIDLDPNYADAYSGLSRFSIYSMGLSLENPLEAFPLVKKYADEALKIHPNHVESKLTKIWVTLHLERDAAKALQIATDLVNLHPDDVRALARASWHFTLSGKFELAITTMKKGLELDPKNSLLHQHLAFTYLVSGEEKLAEFHNQQALELSPNFQFALHIRSLILSRQKRFDEAEKQLLKAIEDDNQNPVTVMSLGIVYWRAGKKEKSYKLLADLLDRRNFEYIKGGILTRFYIAIGEKEEAFKWLRQSRDEKDPDFITIFHWPLYDSVRDDPEFIQIYKDAGVYEHLIKKKL